MHWIDSFRERIVQFEDRHSRELNEVPVSIKVRVDGGCYCRNCCRHAWRIVDRQVSELSKAENRFEIEEHESGPEVIAYVALATAGVTLAKSVIDLVTTVIKARSEGAKSGDTRRESVTLVVRRLKTDDTLAEERTMTFDVHDDVTAEIVRKALLEGCEKITDSAPERKNRSSKQAPRSDSGRSSRSRKKLR